MRQLSLIPVALFVALLVYASPLRAHCDTLGGPVVASARAALAKGDVTPVLRWVNKDSEPEVRAAFDRALAVRAKGDDARELADQYFFETVVRIHRAGEGEPYTGLKPAGEVEPGIAAADAALSKGSADELTKHVSDAVTDGIRTRLARTIELKAHADDSVEAGRQYVAAYVDYIHYVEGIAEAVHRSSHESHDASAPHAH
jgi:hypothetical protein